MSAWRWCGGILAAVSLGGIPLAFAEIDERTRTAIETLSRLKDADLESNAALKQAVLRVLEQARGEPEFLELVRDFRLAGYEADLIDLAVLRPAAPQAVEAVRMALASTNAAVLQPALRGTSALTLVELLGASGDSRAVSWLQPLIADSEQPLETRRAAVSALAQTSEGAQTLLAAARRGELPSDLRAAAASALRAARRPEIRTETDQLFPAESVGGAPLPPLAELLKMSGDPQRGAEVFRRPEVACHTCHQVRGEGIDFGPKLTEIGSKLGPDALIASILDPNSGISFGFEAWRVELKNGDELYGMVVSETADTLSLKQQGGHTLELRKSEVAKREKQAQSIMPAGLEQSLTAQEFIDLIAYLSSLKTTP